jgi:hypothetical protein
LQETIRQAAALTAANERESNRDADYGARRNTHDIASVQEITSMAE